MCFPVTIIVGSFCLAYGSNRKNTIIPLLRYDEGLGNPNQFKANPQHPDFAEVNTIGCYPDSKVYKMFCKVIATNLIPSHSFKTSSGGSRIYVSNAKVLLAYFGLIQTSFKDELDIEDEKTSTTVKSILGLTYETTDRQVYPAWGGNKLPYGKSASLATLPAEEPGLTTNQRHEDTSFNLTTYYDCLSYYTNAGKLKKVMRKLHWRRITGTRPPRS